MGSSRNGDRIYLAELIKLLRKENYWTQAELAKRSGISQAVISDIESGIKTTLNDKQKSSLRNLLMNDIERILEGGGH